MNVVDLVKQKWPQATARSFSGSNDWEIYATEDTDSSLLLGSGSDCPTSPAQDEVNFGGTEEAAWLDALINIKALEKFRELATEMVTEHGLRDRLEEWEVDCFIRATARKFYDAQVPYEFRVMAEQMRTQDNAATANPLFVVYEIDRIYGMDTDYADDNIVWVDAENDYIEADKKKHAALERYRAYFSAEPRGWQRTAYIERNRFAMACFTREAAEDYIRRNRHNMKRPHIFVEHIPYRNWEMKTIRDFLEAL